ncbi:MAG: ATP-binding protein [Solirubrobacteraceae bacterium]
MGLAAACAAGVEIGLILHEPFKYAWVAALFPVNGMLYIGLGLAAWARRPSSRLGLLIVIAGAFEMLAALINIDTPTTTAVGAITATATLAVIFQLLLSFPTGRLHERKERMVVAGGYVVCLILQIPLYLFAGTGVLAVADRPDLARDGLNLQRVVGALMVLATAQLLVTRMRRANPERRRILLPLSVYGIVALLFIPVTSWLSASLPGGAVIPRVLAQLAVIGLVPVGFVIAASRGGFDRTGDIAELGEWLGADELGRPELRDALAATLGDASLQLLFRVPGQAGLVDELGLPVTSPADREGRAVVDVELQGRTVGAIAYDTMLHDQPEELREAGRVVALALDRQRLTVELRASRARIAAAADVERRRIARDLHDGLQSRLVLLAVQAGTDAEPAALRAGIQSSIQELRELVNGVMPAQLTERGLGAAVEGLLDRLSTPVQLEATGLEQRLPPEVETAAYFVVSEAIANAVKHAPGATLAVSLTRTDDRLALEVVDTGAGGVRDGGGLRGMADRVAALGGNLHVDGAPGDGTRICAVIPCAS